MRNPLLLIACAALSAQAQVLLVDEAKVGSRFEVVDRRETTVKILLKARARGSGEARRIASEARYTEEVVGLGPLKLRRTYDQCFRWDHPVSKPSEPARSSQHGRTVRLEGLRRELEDGGNLDRDDRDDLRFERLLAALLPPQRVVDTGDQWEVSGQAINRALFGDGLPAEANDASGAVVKLRSIKRRKEGEVAKLQVKALRVRVKKTLGKPEITLDLSGGFEWDVVRAAVLDAELEGEVLYIAHVPGEVSAEARGPYRWRYQAELLEPEAAPPSED